MFHDPGDKVRQIAKAFFIINSILSVVVMIKLSLANGNYLYAIIGIPISIFLAWLATIVLYAFGELCHDMKVTRENIYALTTIMEKRFPDLVEYEEDDDYDD